MIIEARSKPVILSIALCYIGMALSGPAQAQDDGARAYWKTLEDTNVLGVQYLQFNAETIGSQLYDPAHGIYPDAQTDGRVYGIAYFAQAHPE